MCDDRRKILLPRYAKESAAEWWYVVDSPAHARGNLLSTLPKS